MVKLLTLLLVALWWTFATGLPTAVEGIAQDAPPKIDVVYDSGKDKTTVSLAPVQISGPNGKYHSLHMAPSFTYPVRVPRTPEIIDFELRTVVKGRLKIDLYVLFIVDGEKFFLSSNRWGVKKGHLGRGWMGEHLVFRMPYETFLKITRASSFEINLDSISFPVGAEQLQALREWAMQIKRVPTSMRINGGRSRCTTSVESTRSGANESIVIAEKRQYRRLTGIVRDVNEEVVSDVLVEVFDHPEHLLMSYPESEEMKKVQRRIAACVVGADGRFYFKNIRAGKYEVRFSKDGGWKYTHVHVVVAPGNRKATRRGLVISMQAGT
ncbi:MAG: carboxypeptidase regulatory-like domain-containing protein [Pyrinomonadaceae bacterium]|nr:carboxypeptidase regulatory-like domain-containing protein [Pyrinomonadaceae bacterium]